MHEHRPSPFPTKAVKDKAVLLLLWGADKIPCNRLWTFLMLPGQLCSPQWGGCDVAPIGLLQPCSFANTAHLQQHSPAIRKASPKGQPTTMPRKSQKKVPSWRTLFGLGRPVVPKHPFCKSKQHCCQIEQHCTQR